MNLYEALNDGMAVEELRAIFEKDLSEALEKKAKEEEKKNEFKKANIAAAREELVNATIKYCEAVFGLESVTEKDKQDLIEQFSTLEDLFMACPEAFQLREKPPTPKKVNASRDKKIAGNADNLTEDLILRHFLEGLS